MNSSRSLVVAFALAAASWHCSAPAVEEIETAAPVAVEVETATLDDVESRIDVAGIVTPAPGADLTIVAPEAARISELSKAEGDAVKAGEVLVRFDIPTLAANVAGRRADIAQARARLETARAAVTRLRGLLERGIASQREVQEAERDAADAEAALARAEGEATAAASLADRAVVRARFNGVVVKRWHNPGDLVEGATSDPVLRVIDPRTLQVVASVPAAHLLHIVVGRSASVRGPGGEDAEEATVVAKAAQLDPTGSVGDVRLTFKSRTQFAAGTPVQVSIVADQHEKVVVVPTAAVLHDGDETYVMVAGADHVAHRQLVEVGLTGSETIEIVKGVVAGDRVIVSGHTALPDGAAISVTP
jgi:RND family efflux transporter MFP subunit